MSRRVHDHSRTAWLAVGLGGWLWAAPFALGYPRYHPYLRATVNDLAVGTAVVTLGLLSVLRGDRAQGALRGLVVCALWLLAADPALGLRSGLLRAAAVNDPATGAALLLVALLVLLLAARRAPDRTAPDQQRRQPVLWAAPLPGQAPAAFRGRAGDDTEQQARGSIGWAYAAIATAIVGCVLLGLALVLRSWELLVAGLVVGVAGGGTAAKVHILADTTVGQSPRGA